MFEKHTDTLTYTSVSFPSGSSTYSLTHRFSVVSCLVPHFKSLESSIRCRCSYRVDSPTEFYILEK